MGTSQPKPNVYWIAASTNILGILTCRKHEWDKHGDFMAQLISQHAQTMR